MKHFYRIFLCLLCVIPYGSIKGQLQEPVKFNVETKRIDNAHIELIFKGVIEEGWHVYSTELSGGPTAASLHVEQHEGMELDGKLKPASSEMESFDPVFNMNVRFFENTAEFHQILKLTAPSYQSKGYLEYGACNDENCIPPSQVEFSISGKDGPDKKNIMESGNENEDTSETQTQDKTSDSLGITNQLAKTDSATASIASSTLDSASLWQPVIQELSAFDNNSTQNKNLLIIFGLGLLGGLLALLTPCVWPIIPMTVSFFLHRNKNRKRAVQDAIMYGLSIMVIYVGTGLLITLLSSKGASALNDMSTNAVFNLFFFVLLVLFGTSFLGAFEITLPSSWTNKVNNKADSLTGLLSLFLMAFTLVLVSFSCTGPIIGFLLVEISTKNNILAPFVGMTGFAISLALPFSVFALFPSWMKKMPHGGGWMNVIKVTLGFIELAFSLKFLSVADLTYGWHVLDREVFLSLWIVLFFLLGWYLLGKLHFPNDEKTEYTSVSRFMLGLCSLAFAIYLVPGLWGAPLKAISAFAPPTYTQDFRLGKQSVEPQFKDFEAGMAYATKNGKPVLLDFTGYGCVNCRKMEMAVWNDEIVAKTLNNDFILISLYVDDKTALPKPITVMENGKERKLRTIGDKWSYLQRTKFGANAQPFYVTVDHTGHPLTRTYGFDENVPSFLQFLKEALAKYAPIQ